MMKPRRFLILCCFLLAHLGPDSLSAQEIVIEAGSPAIGADGHLAEPVGIETLGGVFTELLPQGCALACSATETFTTAEDGQDQITVSVYRGRAERVSDATHVGSFLVRGFDPGPRGQPKVAITFSADLSGLRLSATDLHSGRECQISKLNHDS
jgi:molecular chaperone DnaK